MRIEEELVRGNFQGLARSLKGVPG